MLIYILLPQVVEVTRRGGRAVEGTSLENWHRFVAYRGFESHPLRQNNIN